MSMESNGEGHYSSTLRTWLASLSYVTAGITTGPMSRLVVRQDMPDAQTANAHRGLIVDSAEEDSSAEE